MFAVPHPLTKRISLAKGGHRGGCQNGHHHCPQLSHAFHQSCGECCIVDRKQNKNKTRKEREFAAVMLDSSDMEFRGVTLSMVKDKKQNKSLPQINLYT